MLNQNHPLVSICIINYNASAYLKDCVQSILNQTYKNIEIVFCDDASTDDSIEIFENLIKDCEDIVINRQYKQINGGVEANMLTGLHAFTGDFVCNIDSDDALAPKHIETLVGLLFATSADIACTNHIEFTNELPRNSFKSYDDTDIKNSLVYSTNEVLETLFLREQKIPFAYWHRLYKKNNAKKIVELPIEYFTNSDSAFSLAQLCNADKIAYLNIPTYLYRVREHSVSRKSWHDYLNKKTLFSLDKLSSHFSSKYPALLVLNEYRNNKTLSWMFDAAIDEKKGYSQIIEHYKQYINNSNKVVIADFLTETLNGTAKKMIKKSFMYTPVFYYLYRKNISYLKGNDLINRD